MENLNAEQVKKALEKVEDTYIYLYRGTDGLWHEVRYSHILALINSQEQRIKELTEELDDAKRDTIPKLRCSLERANAMGVEADKTIEKLTVENERLQKNIETYRGRLKALKKEISNLDEKNKLLIQNRYGIESHPYLTIVGHKKMLEYRIQFDPKIDLIEKARADTVRKMRTRIKSRCIEGGIYPAFVERVIDEVTKEMLEGEK